MSRARVVQHGKLKSWERDTAPVKMLPVSRFLIMFCAITTFVEFVLHVFDADPSGRDFAWKNLVFSMFASSYFFLEATRKVEIVGPEHFGGYADIIFKQVLPAFFAVTLVQAFISFTLQFELFAIYDIEIYYFYLNAGWAEEVLMRVLFMTVMKHAIPSPPDEGRQMTKLASWQVPARKRGKQPTVQGAFTTFMNGFARAAVIITTTSLAFMLAHYWVYGDNPWLLFSTFLTGLVFGTAYYTTGNYLASAIPHVLNNAWAAGVVMQNSYLALVGDPVYQVVFVAVLVVIGVVMFKAYKAKHGKKNTRATPSWLGGKR